MNWIEFYRTLTWFLTVLVAFGGFVMIAVYVDGKRQSWKLVLIGFLIITAIIGFSVIGGMDWGVHE